MLFRSIHLSDVRGFARYLRNSEPRTEIPPTGLIPRSGDIFVVETQDEIHSSAVGAASKKDLCEHAPLYISCVSVQFDFPH